MHRHDIRYDNTASRLPCHAGEAATKPPYPDAGTGQQDPSSVRVTETDRDYALVAQAIEYLSRDFRSHPSLEELATHLHVSPYHLQRVFSRWAGISPKRFIQFLTLDYAKSLLRQRAGVLETAYAAGLSGPGRLHDLFVTLEAVTPGEYKQGGAGLTLHVGRHTTPFGDCLLATTARGICALNFLDDGRNPAAAWHDARTALAQAWPAATLVDAPEVTAPLAARIFAAAAEHDPAPLPVLVKGTNFQIKVWEALLRIPPGTACTYSDIAVAVCGPAAARAVGGAVGANAVAYLIPCHRVLRKDGAAGDYRWGATRKRAILSWEAARQAAFYAFDNEDAVA